MLRKSFYMVLALLLISSLSLFAQDCKDKKTDCSTDCSSTCTTTTSDCDHGDVVESSGVQTSWNGVCPVKGEKLPENAPTYEYAGKIWGFCCQDCLNKFKADPEKYKSNVSPCGKSYVGKKS
ncbi:MAG: YHS domain-containing protein [Ignavibacteriales bacterium]|nr:YHS domain-containing protein [Ignavibacteriales bacterium]